MDKLFSPPKGSPELLKKAQELHKKVYHKPIWTKEKYKTKTGHMLRRLFGPPVWTLKDLDDKQLEELIMIVENKIKKHL